MLTASLRQLGAGDPVDTCRTALSAPERPLFSPLKWRYRPSSA